MVQWVKKSPAIQETQVRFLSQEDSLEEEMATHFSILVWEIPWTDKPGGLQSMGSQGVRHDQAQHSSIIEFWLLVPDLTWAFSEEERGSIVNLETKLSILSGFPKGSA